MEGISGKEQSQTGEENRIGPFGYRIPDQRRPVGAWQG